MGDIILNIYLGIGAVKDIKTKKIAYWYLAAGIMTSVLFGFRNFMLSEEKVIFCLLPGIFFFLIALRKKEAIGAGDGLLLCIIGIWIGKNVWSLLYGSMILITCFSVVCLLCGKVSFSSKLPYVPFLWLSHTILLGFSYG